MEFITKISLSKPVFEFSYHDKVMLIGSCFADNIGTKLNENKFDIDINPFGTLYNPASIAFSIKRLVDPRPFTPDDLIRHEGICHSFMHHSRFSSPSEEEVVCNINQRLNASSVNLAKATRLIITFGTSFVYRLKSNGNVVSNCHKLPDHFFSREMLSADSIVDEWDALLLSAWKQNRDLKILFTVSPIRHWKDGAHANQLSKATLLLAIDRLQKRYPLQTGYFPAYEIMMDELRDYRFYADDMLHPSPLAIEYIWNRFIENCLSEESKNILKEWLVIKKAINHRPFQPESGSYRKFISQTLLKAERIREKYPYFYLDNEIKLLQGKIN